MELPFIIHTVRVRSSGTGALDISLFANPPHHQGGGLSNTRGVKHLEKYVLDILCVAGIKPALECIANGICFLQGEVDHIRPIAIGIVDFESICCLSLVAGVSSLV